MPLPGQSKPEDLTTSSPRSGLDQPCAAANPAIASLLQSWHPAGRVAELGSLAGIRASHVHETYLIEIHDQDWCPRAVRDGETDYLQFVIATTKPYAAMVPILAAALRRTGARQVLDLCSGAAGPWLWLQPVLAEQGVSVSVCLTDKADAPNAAMTLRFRFERYWRGIGESRRSP